MAGGCCEEYKAELQFRNCCFGDLSPATKSHKKLDWFTQFADGGLFFKNSPRAFMGFRWLLAISSLIVLVDNLVRNLDPEGLYFIFLTNISFILIVIYLFSAAIVTTYLNVNRFKVSREGTGPCYVRFVMVLQHINLPVALGVTLLYWGILYDPDDDISISDILMHTFNAIVVILDMVFSLQPVYLIAGFYPVLFSTLYGIWTLIHYVAGLSNRFGCTCIYGVLHWGENPGQAAAYAFGAAIVLMPLLLTLMWCVKNRCILRHRHSAIPQEAERASVTGGDITGTQRADNEMEAV